MHLEKHHECIQCAHLNTTYAMNAVYTVYTVCTMSTVYTLYTMYSVRTMYTVCALHNTAIWSINIYIYGSYVWPIDTDHIWPRSEATAKGLGRSPQGAKNPGGAQPPGIHGFKGRNTPSWVKSVDPLLARDVKRVKLCWPPVCVPPPETPKTSSLRWARSGAMDPELYFLTFDSISSFKIMIMQ